MMHIFLQMDTWLTLLILTLLEVILGIDNVIFIIIATHRLPAKQQRFARRAGLALAMILRLILLSLIFWLAQLIHPLFNIGNFAVSIRDLILLLGGIFLVVKASHELYDLYKAHEHQHKQSIKQASLYLVLSQIVLLDLVFSLDSIITAVALAQYYLIMALAIIIAVIAMMVASEPLNRLIHRYSRLKILALIFIMLVGAVLILHGLHVNFPNWYLYILLLITSAIVLPRRSKSKVSSYNRQGR